METFLLSIADPNPLSGVPFHFWSVVFFVFGSIVGNFLNVCIYRLPLEQALVSPPSQCPHAKCPVPWHLNIPLVAWLFLRGQCWEFGASISIRYLLIELLTGTAFLGCWLAFGHQSEGLALVYSVFLAGLIVATATDFDHFIISDEITFGGMIAGVLCSLLLPRLQAESAWLRSLGDSLVGLAVGGGGIYAVLRGGKMVFGRQRVRLPGSAKIIFTETGVHLPDRDISFDELFYRKSDAIILDAKTVELADRCYRDVRVHLTPAKLNIGEDEFNPEEVLFMEVLSEEIVLPREAMGLGDAKLMAAIGAFLGWKAVIFTVTVGALVGSVYGVGMITLRRQAWSGRIYFGPFLALAAALWVFHGAALVRDYQELIQRLLATAL
jgi:leader peptidase (prepilin peptidase) / N-methyltransferase